MSYASEIARLSTEVGEFVARHESTKDLAEFTRYADDPEGFFADVLHAPPMWSRQLEMAELVRDHPRVAVLSANGIGKDWLCARLALFWVYARRGLVVLTSTTERQVKNILMREVRRAFVMASDLPGELFQMELRVNDDMGILAFTSDHADRLLGFHHPRLLIALSEAQGIDDGAYEAAFACCTAPENRIFAYGNPTNVNSQFYRVATSETWQTLAVPASEHPNVISGRAEIPGAITREWVASMADEYGTNSSIYKSRVLAQFPEESLEGLIKRQWMLDAFDRHESKVLADPWRAPLLAVDVARFGPDSSVLAVVRGPVVESLHTWHGASITETVDKCIEHANRLTMQVNPKLHLPDNIMRPTFAIDEPGIGGGVIDLLAKKGWRVHSYNGAHKPHSYANEKRFLNKRSETHWLLRTLLENNKIALPRDAMLLEEALAIEWQLNPQGGKIQIVSKETIRETLKRSPDRLDAVVIGLCYSMGMLQQRALVGTYNIGHGGISFGTSWREW